MEDDIEERIIYRTAMVYIKEGWYDPRALVIELEDWLVQQHRALAKSMEKDAD